MGWKRGLLGAFAAVLVVPLLVSPARAAEAGPLVGVVVRTTPSRLAAVEDVVADLDGRITHELAVISGFSALVPAGRVAELAAEPGVVVDRDGSLELASFTGGYSNGNDTGSLFNTGRSMGIDKLWNKHASGQGVGVALIDSGVTPVPGLTGGQVVNGPDFSLDASNPQLRHLDEFGHGTHLAGIIAGRDSSALNYGAYNDQSRFTGIAPDARLVNVKVGAADGSVDVSQVLAGIDWVVQHRNDNGMNIRVLVLAFGTDGTQAYDLDPLAYATEVAWRAGIVVVVAAGNQGTSSTSLTNPAMDPFVIAVGASAHDDKDGSHPRIATFTSTGSATRSPDLIAPGTSIVSLRDPGSWADTVHPEGRVGDPANRYARASGTSQAAAVVGGVVADVLSLLPTLTPDQVKGLLRQYAVELAGVDVRRQGDGEVQVDTIAGVKIQNVGAFAQTMAPSTGTGTLEGARGSFHLRTADGSADLTGAATVFGVDFDGTAAAWDALRAASAGGGAWTGSSWSGSSWSSDSWSGSSWSGSSWSGSSWSGSSWSGSSWSGSSWSGSSWSGSSWSGSAWATSWG